MARCVDRLEAELLSLDHVAILEQRDCRKTFFAGFAGQACVRMNRGVVVGVHRKPAGVGKT